MPTSRSVYDYAIRPHEGVGPIKFGMLQDDVRKAMRPFRPKKSRDGRVLTDLFHGHGLKTIYSGPGGSVQAVKISQSADIWGRIGVRPRYLRTNGMNLFGHHPAKVIDRICLDSVCDPFVDGHPGEYCAPELGLVLHYCDFDDPVFGSLILATDDYLARFPSRYRVRNQR